MKSLLLAAVALTTVAVQARAATIEFLHVPSISSMQYRDNGAWSAATINEAHGQFESSADVIDVLINGTVATHDFTGMTAGAFVTVVGKTQAAWAFNYDPYAGDEVTRWLPVAPSQLPVPEPSSASLAILGAICLVATWRVSR